MGKIFWRRGYRQSSDIRTDSGEDTVGNDTQAGSTVRAEQSTDKGEWDGGGMEEKQEGNVEGGAWPGLGRGLASMQ